jgi:hypothetical protein
VGEGAKRRAKDPWTATVRMVCKDPKTGDLYVFSSSSHGGRNKGLSARTIRNAHRLLSQTLKRAVEDGKLAP